MSLEDKVGDDYCSIHHAVAADDVDAALCQLALNSATSHHQP